MFDRAIFVSGEDDKYQVLGGIGTYLGILTRWIRILYPATEVYWVTKSPTNEDLIETDVHGVTRIYLAEFAALKDLPFIKKHPKLMQERTAKYASFLHRTEEIVVQLLREAQNKNVLLESGEWEGHTHGIFRAFDASNLLKVVRLHTPLAVCMGQNQLLQSGSNYLQMLNEFQQIKHADFISSCTDYMKEKVIQEVLGPEHPLSSKIATLANPIDTTEYACTRFTRDESLHFVNQLRPGSVTDKTFNIFVIGSVESRKGVEYIIDAIPETVQAISEARFCFFGHHAPDDADWSNANTKLSPQSLYAALPKEFHKNLIFYNYVPHSKLPLVLAGGDVFPILSLGDNFPGSVAEIALSSKPIAALERGGVKEMLQDTQGLFRGFSLGSDLGQASKRLANALIQLHANKEMRTELGHTLQQLLMHKYNPETVVPNLMQTYWDALCEKQRNDVLVCQ